MSYFSFLQTQKYFRQTHTAVNETWHHKKFDSLKPATHTARQKEPDSYMKTDSGSLKHLMDGFTKKMVSPQYDGIIRLFTSESSCISYVVLPEVKYVKLS